MNYYRGKIRDLIAEICEFEFARSWRKKIRHAFQAHRGKKYDLAAPLFLIIIDGIARAIARDKGFRLFHAAGSPKSYGKSVQKVAPYRDQLDIFGAAALIQALFTLSRGSKQHRPGIGLNRHAILTGSIRPLGPSKNRSNV